MSLPSNAIRRKTVPWNKGLTKENDERLLKASQTLKNTMKGRVINFSEEGLLRLSIAAKSRQLGGYRPHPNKGSRYKGIWFDSNWEIIVAKSLDENGIAWKRPLKGFEWDDEGHKYYPDFYLNDFNVYLDPKNDYLRAQHKFKIESAQSRNRN